MLLNSSILILYWSLCSLPFIKAVILLSKVWFSLLSSKITSTCPPSKEISIPGKAIQFVSFIASFTSSKFASSNKLWFVIAIIFKLLLKTYSLSFSFEKIKCLSRNSFFLVWICKSIFIKSSKPISCWINLALLDCF